MDASQKVGRRRFIETTLSVGAGLTLAGCTQSLPRQIVPQVTPSDGEVPGKAVLYRSVCRACPAGCGLTARVREGRAVKLEGSTENTIGLGALCATGQAAIDDLYSPQRLGKPMMPGAGDQWQAARWTAAKAALVAGLKRAVDQKKQIVIVTRPEPGAVGDLFRSWLSALGQDPTQVAVFDPMSPDWLREAAKRSFGIDGLPRYDLGRARLVVSVGADLLEDLGSPVEHSRGLAELRSPGHGPSARLVYIGPRLSLTAAQADTFISVPPGSELDLVLGLCREALRLAPKAAGLPDGLAQALAPWDPQTVAASTGLESHRITALAQALVSARPSLCVGPGRSAVGPEAVTLAQAVYLLNAICGNLGQTLRFDAPPPTAQATLPAAATAPAIAAAVAPTATAAATTTTATAAVAQVGISLSMAELAKRAAAGEIGALIVHHADPLGYGAAFASLGQAFERIPFVAAFGNRLDATSRRAHVVLPDHHFLETWDQLALRPGVQAIQQPVMTPLLKTRAAADVLLDAARALGHTTGLPDGSFAEQLQSRLSQQDIERGGTFVAATLTTPVLTAAPLELAGRKPTPPSSQPSVLLVPSVRHLDGRSGVHPLLEEIPDPVTTVSWSGWVEVHPKTAGRQGIRTGDLLRLQANGHQAELPAIVHAGVREEVFAVPLAYAPALLAEGAWLGGRVAGARVEPASRRFSLPIAAGSFTDEHRGLVREVGPSGVLPKEPPRASLYPDVDTGKRRWALAVDLDRCNGCGACVAACYVENNVAIVGPEQLRNGRSMAWLRVERFLETDGDTARVKLLPVMCQQCGAAPCEPVCPAYATYHTDEGLNAQIYNRCVGTRFCGNNCPYVARRFNWFDWPHPAPSNLGLNPDVTVRSRGVMEKCTFCVQRIRVAEERARMENRPLHDGEVVPACAQTCSAGALVFGDLMDKGSRVAQLATDGRAYGILEELNTRPGVTYLARRRHEETV